MELLQQREHEIFEALKALKNCAFVVIGGYAANAYALPRFSVDCDIVVKDEKEAEKIKKILIIEEYSPVSITGELYGGNFGRYEKKLGHNFKVSIDILMKEVVDRLTKVRFSADWIFENSTLQLLRGKTILESLTVRIINLDALVVMKSISGRATDVRDVFMLAPNIKDKKWVQQEISKRYDFNDRFHNLAVKIQSKQFKDGLQGVYGYINEKTFEKHIKAVLDLGHYL